VDRKQDHNSFWNQEELPDLGQPPLYAFEPYELSHTSNALPSSALTPTESSTFGSRHLYFGTPITTEDDSIEWSLNTPQTGDTSATSNDFGGVFDANITFASTDPTESAAALNSIGSIFDNNSDYLNVSGNLTVFDTDLGDSNVFDEHSRLVYAGGNNFDIYDSNSEYVITGSNPSGIQENNSLLNVGQPSGYQIGPSNFESPIAAYRGSSNTDGYPNIYQPGAPLNTSNNSGVLRENNSSFGSSAQNSDLRGTGRFPNVYQTGALSTTSSNSERQILLPSFNTRSRVSGYWREPGRIQPRYLVNSSRAYFQLIKRHW